MSSYKGPEAQPLQPAAPAAPADQGITVGQVLGYAVTVASFVAPPVAVALSYSQNASVPWAVAHGLVAPGYLVYRAALYAVGR